MTATARAALERAKAATPEQGEQAKRIAAFTDRPCSRWSDRNRLLMAIEGTADARGYKQWIEAGRKVKAGEKAFYILIPCIKGERGEDGRTAGECYGFRGCPVFGIEQTDEIGGAA